MRPVIGSDHIGYPKRVIRLKTSGKGDSYHPFGCAINNGKNIITIVTELQRAHQMDVKVRETPLGYADLQQLGPSVAMNLALLAVQDSLGPGCYILGKTVLDISRRHKPRGGKPPRVGNVVQVKKMFFQNFSGTTGQKTHVDMSPTRC
jgi:hypothetical protein